MDLLFFVTSGIFFVAVLHEILYWVGIWQVRDYQWKRVYVFVFRTYEGRRKFFSLTSTAKILGIVLYIYTIFQEQYFFLFQLYIFSVFLLHFFFISVDHFSKTVTRPIITVRTLFIVGLSSSATIVLFVFPVIEKFLWLVIIDRLLFLLICFFIFISSFPTELYRDYHIAKAMQRLKILRSRKDMLVVAVTGSSGKSITKDYMRQILSSEYNVVTNPSKHATEIGIAKTIITSVDDATDILIADMGAYKKGDIWQMTHMLEPDIGIITGISPNHLSLFRRMSKLVAMKLELVERIKRKSLILANGNTFYGLKELKQTKKRKVYYFLSDKKSVSKKNNIVCSDIKESKDKISFTVTIENQKETYVTSLVGIHQIQSLLPAIYIAQKLGIQPVRIKKQVKSLISLSHSMVKKISDDGVIIIDNTMHATIESANAMAQYFTHYKKKKIYVLQPIEELGGLSAKVHEELGEKIGAVCDVLLVTNRNNYKAIKKGVKKSGGNCLLITGSTKQLGDFVNRTKEVGDIIGFEGQETAYIMQKVL